MVTDIFGDFFCYMRPKLKFENIDRDDRDFEIFLGDTKSRKISIKYWFGLRPICIKLRWPKFLFFGDIITYVSSNTYHIGWYFRPLHPRQAAKWFWLTRVGWGPWTLQSDYGHKNYSKCKNQINVCFLFVLFCCGKKILFLNLSEEQRISLG